MAGRYPSAPSPSLAPGHPAPLGGWPLNRAFLKEEDWLSGSVAGWQRDRAQACEPAGWAQRSLHLPIPTGSPHRPVQAGLGWAWLPVPRQSNPGNHRHLSQGQPQGPDLGAQEPLGGGVSDLFCLGMRVG